MILPPDLTLVRRVAWGTVGVLWFLWIAYEDQGLIAITVFAAVIAFASGLTVFHRWVGERELPQRDWLIRSGAVGLFAGAAVGPIASLLMLVKMGLHAHPEPDFNPDQFVQTLGLTVYWAALGAVIGVGLGLLARPNQD